MKKQYALLILLSVFISACSVLHTIENVGRLKYKIYSATDYRLQGIDLSGKRSLKDFNSVEMLKLTAGFIKGNLPLTFVINVEAKNPNDGKGGYPATDITLAGFPYRLFINEKEILKGDIEKQIVVPGVGESVIIPIKIEFDIAKSFKEKSLDDILLLLLQAGGVKGSTSNIKLLVQPSMGTPIGTIKYPEEITVVDKSFN
jgi:hypothetical protein